MLKQIIKTLLLLCATLAHPTTTEKNKITSSTKFQKNIEYPPLAIKPVRIHRIVVFYINAVDASFKSNSGRIIKIKKKIKSKEIKKTKFQMRALAQFIKKATFGYVTIEFKTFHIRATIKKVHVGKHRLGNNKIVEVRSPVLESLTTTDGSPFNLGKILFKYGPKYDTLAFFWPIGKAATVATGGGITYPLVPYQLYSPIRGHIFQPSHWSSARIFIHEFFHSVEGMLGISPAHGYTTWHRHLFPKWKGRGELNYYRWHFKTTARKKGYKNLNFRLRWPWRISKKTYIANIAIAKKISIGKRQAAWKLMRKASKLWHAKKFVPVAQLSKRALKHNPWNLNAHHYLSLYEARRKHWHKAAYHFEQLRSLNPYLWSLNYLANIYIWHIKQPARALPILKEALKLSEFSKQKASIYFSLGRALKKIKQYKKALTPLHKAVRLYTQKKDKSGPLWEIGSCYQAIDKNSQRAIKFWRRAATAYPTAWRWKSVGWHQYAKLKRYIKALASYKRALKLAKKQKTKADTHWHMGHINKRIKRYREAIYHFKRAAYIYRNRKSKASATWEVGSCTHSKNKKYHSAIRLWKLATRYYPTAWRWRHIGIIYYWRLKNYHQAHIAFLNALRLEEKADKKEALYLDLGRNAYQLKRYPKAIHYFNRAASSPKPNVRSSALWSIGDCLQKIDKKITRAIRWYRKAARAHTSFWRWRTIAWLEYTRLKQFSQSVRSYQQALKLVKKSQHRADLYLNLGRLHLRWKKPQKALRYLQQGIKINSNNVIKSAILWEIGSTLTRIDKHRKRGIQFYEQAARTKPYGWRWYSIGATYQWHLKKRNAAILAYKKALLYYKKRSQKAITWTAIGRCYMDNNQLTAARKAFNNAFHLDRKGKRGAEALFWLGYLYGEKLMDETRARRLIQKAIRLGYVTNFAQKKLRQYSR